MRLVFLGSGWLSIVDEIRRRLPEGVTIRARDFTRPLADEIADADVLLPSNQRLDAAALAAPPGLVLVQQPAAGYEGIDLDAARARGVPVCNAPGINAGAVAEATLLLLLGLARRLPAARRAFAAARIGEPVGVELAGRTLALVGEGRTGGEVRRLARALGMRVESARSSTPPAELAALLGRADFVSIHCPLTPRTRGLFDEALLAAMKPGAFLVNVSRGAIVSRPALEAALASGRLAGVGLDVFWDEPWDPADPLFARDDVLTLPHLGGSTEEVFARLADLVAENVRRVRRGEEPLHRVA
jgi:phosphoglycerate dehydrogenase-like enzyme